MKIKILFFIKQVLCSFLDVKANTKTAYKIFKMLKQIENETMFYEEKFKEIFKEYGERDVDNNLIFDDKGNIKIKQEKVEDCKKSIDELDNLEIDKPNISFTLEELEPFNLSVNQIILLQNFIREEV